MVLDSYEGFFELHSWATEQEKDKVGVQNGDSCPYRIRRVLAKS
jgi:hypothetical protein